MKKTEGSGEGLSPKKSGHIFTCSEEKGIRDGGRFVEKGYQEWDSKDREKDVKIYVSEGSGWQACEMNVPSDLRDQTEAAG